MHDRTLPDYGIGFTDIVKSATPNIRKLEDEMLLEGGRQLRQKLDHYRPRAACFQGITAYRPFCRAFGLPWEKLGAGSGFSHFASAVFGCSSFPTQAGPMHMSAVRGRSNGMTSSPSVFSDQLVMAGLDGGRRRR